MKSFSVMVVPQVPVDDKQKSILQAVARMKRSVIRGRLAQLAFRPADWTGIRKRIGPPRITLRSSGLRLLPEMENADGVHRAVSGRHRHDARRLVGFPNAGACTVRRYARRLGRDLSAS